jgi:hypothetical protein
MSLNLRFTRLALCERGTEIVLARLGLGLGRTKLTAAAQRHSGAGLVRALILVAACLPASQLCATPASGFTAQAFRGQITQNVSAHHLSGDPLFMLLLHSSVGQQGYDVIQATAQFAPLDSMGRPSQTGWHDHPTAISIGLVIHGTIWLHQDTKLDCARPLPTGSVFFQRDGTLHNVYNFDPATPAVVQVFHLIDRNEAALRRDQPDPITGDPMTATTPPPCPAGVAAADNATASPNWMLMKGSVPQHVGQLPPPPEVIFRQRRLVLQAE